MLDVTQRLVEQHRDMRVIESVDRLPPGADADHEIEVSQDPQLMRHRRLRHADGATQLADAARTFSQTTENLDPARRPEACHHPRDPLRSLRRDPGT